MPNHVHIEIDVPVAMRDGTLLRANVYQPAEGQDFPVLLTRLPYGKDFPLGTAFLDPVRAAQAGYIVVIQDVRGRYRSDGQWDPFVFEFDDGYDTVEWCANLPRSNGKVGMYGGSYFGMTQWQAAVGGPPHLASLFPAITWGNHLNGTHRRGGAFEWGLWAYWILNTLALDTVARQWRSDPAHLQRILLETVQQIDALAESGYNTLPLNQLPGIETIAPYFHRMMAEPLDSPVWNRLNITGRFDRITIPSYLLGGWYDIFLGETLNNYQLLKKNRIPGSPRLIIGPWAHGLFSNVIGERDFGLATSAQFINYREDLTGLQLRWFDATLKSLANGLWQEPPVQVFVMGENRWRYFTDWPVPSALPLDLYLDSAGHANTRHGDGMLTPALPCQRIPDRYIYDPQNPVPTEGGALLMPGLYPQGPKDQSAIEERPDVLCYSTMPLADDVIVIGPVTLTLYIASTAPDTDFVARLVDVFPDGRAYNLTDGITRASYRGADWTNPSAIRPSLLDPHQVYALTIDLWATANTFRAGHRIRLDVTSSSFPRWDRNLNTGQSGLDSAHMASAQETIFHDLDRPSVLHLMTIPAHA